MAAVPEQILGKVLADRQDIDPIETEEWLQALDGVIRTEGATRATYLIDQQISHARVSGVNQPFHAETPYINTIPVERQARLPGDQHVEHRIRSYTRWNAMAVVLRANKDTNVGGHISSFQSAATLYDIGFNHFWHAPSPEHGGDLIFVQGHSAPGIYARAYMLGRLTEEQLNNFRQEVGGKGISSYPHPWLMPDFWQFPTVSMGLGPIMAIYQARFMRYLQDRGFAKTDGRKVWAFLGDGETDEPESLGAIGMAGREKLDNLIFVINCNLQRLDGPVRGNGKIIQELEALFRGAGWNVVKVIWGEDWDSLFEKDTEGLLARRMGEIVDGEYQKYSVSPGAYIREKFFAQDPRLLEMVAHLSDEELAQMRRGGHDPVKVYAAYKAAVEYKGAPTVILAKTIKGYGLGESGEGKNISHQQKKLNDQELKEFRSRFNIPLSDLEVTKTPFYKPAEDSPEMQYIRQRRSALGGSLPLRRTDSTALKTPSEEIFEEFYKGTEGRTASTTMAYVRILSKLLRDENIGKFIVPIIPDEGRTFGMEGLFRQCGIYSHVGQLYEPVDRDSLMYYKEAKDGQILEEGINEAGSISSFIAAGTAYASHNINMIPFYTYYSMFGPQRVGDLVWAAGDLRCRGFLVGGTSGRTTLNGEGLQHQDGHTHLLTSTVPNLISYDPAFAYEIAVIIREGIYRMYEKQESVFYYISVGNENYSMPPIPGDVKTGIIKGLYRFSQSTNPSALKAHLLGSGAIMLQVLEAQKILETKYNVSCDVWSATSYNELRREALHIERENLLNGKKTLVPYVTQLLQNEKGVFVSASDYMKVLGDSIRQWVPGPYTVLGTDGFGRSESREALRDFFEVDAKHIVWATLTSLHEQKQISDDVLSKAQAELKINPKKRNPMNT